MIKTLSNLVIASVLALCSPVLARTTHHKLTDWNGQESCYEWESAPLPPFDELMVSWKAERPPAGARYTLQVSLQTEDGYSPFLPYAVWEHDAQHTFSSKQEGDQDTASTAVLTDQDIVMLKGDHLASRFKVRIVASHTLRADQLHPFFSLHASHINTALFKASQESNLTPVTHRCRTLLQPPPVSQMEIADERKSRLCSPTSLTSAIRFFNMQNGHQIVLDPLAFAESVFDNRFDIFGNWVLNVAEANRLLPESVVAWVERVDDFDLILDDLERNRLTILSIRGPLPGSALPYASGHLLVVCGFDPESNEVTCMDPAFDTAEQTRVRYKRQDLEAAWRRRGRIAYRFGPLPFLPAH